MTSITGENRQSTLSRRRRSAWGATCLLTLTAALFLVAGSSARGALWWDPNQNTSGGSGEWNFADPSWRDSPFSSGNHVPWVNGEVARFTDGSGTVTVAAPVETGNNFVVEDTYTFNGVGGATITHNQLSVQPGATATFNLSVIDGIGGAHWANGGRAVFNNTVSLPSGNVRFRGGGTYVFNADNSSTIGGSTNTLVEAQFEVGHNKAFGQGGLWFYNNGGIVATGGAKTFTNHMQTRNAPVIEFGGKNNLTFTGNLAFGGSAMTFDVTNTGTTTFNGVISGSSGRNVIKTGSQALTFNGNNTYAGTTSINEGTLLVNGTTSGQGAYTIGAAGTLGGNGTIGLASGAALTVNGTIAPGSSTGTSVDTLSVNGGVTFGSGGTLFLDIASGGNDLLDVNGVAQLAGDLIVVLEHKFRPDPSDTFTVLTADSLLGTFSSVYNRWGRFDVSYENNQVVLSNYVPLPEPASWALLGGLGAILVWRKRSLFCRVR